MTDATDATLAGNRAAMDRFLEKLAKTGNVTLAAKGAGVDRVTVYRWRKRWRTFADEWGAALDEAVDMLEGIAWERAKKSSDRLLQFLLKAHRRDFYGDQQLVGGIEGKPIEHLEYIKRKVKLTNDILSDLPNDFRRDVRTALVAEVRNGRAESD